MEICTVVTRDREEMVDITGTPLLRDPGKRLEARRCGTVLPHTTCGLTINEGADPDVRRDMTAFFQPPSYRTRENGGMGKATATRTLRRALWDRPCS